MHEKETSSVYSISVPGHVRKHVKQLPTALVCTRGGSFACWSSRLWHLMCSHACITCFFYTSPCLGSSAWRNDWVIYSGMYVHVCLCRAGRWVSHSLCGQDEAMIFIVFVTCRWRKCLLCVWTRVWPQQQCEGLLTTFPSMQQSHACAIFDLICAQTYEFNAKFREEQMQTPGLRFEWTQPWSLPVKYSKQL